MSLRNLTTVELAGNVIQDNSRFGVYLSGSSDPDFKSVNGNYGNWISDNLSFTQFYIASSSFDVLGDDLVNGHNNIVSPDDEGYLIYDALDETHDVRWNYFGNPANVDGDRFYPAGYTWNPPDNEPNTYIPDPVPPSKRGGGGLVSSDDSTAAELLRQGIEALRDSLFEEAAECFDRILDQYSESPGAPSAITHIYMAYTRGDLDMPELVEQISVLIEADPTRAIKRAADRTLAACHLRIGDLESAFEVCEGQLAQEDCLHADSLDIMVDLARIMFRMNDDGDQIGSVASKRYSQLVARSQIDLDKLLCRICAEEINLSTSTSEVALPDEFILMPPYPNPFNSATTITYHLPHPAHVSLVVYDLCGRMVDTLVDEQLAGGIYSATWQPDNLASGLYFVRLEVPRQVLYGKLILIK